MGSKSTSKKEAKMGGPSTSQPKMGHESSSKAVDASRSQTQSFRPYDAYVSAQFLVGSFFLCIIITFALGIVCHTLLMDSLVSSGSINMDSPAAESFQALQNLPKLYYEPTKPIPLTMYSSKTFTTDGSMHASSATVLAEKKQQQQHTSTSNVCTSLDGSQGQCRLVSTEMASSAPVRKNETPNGDGDVHEPAGQHLLVDMQNIDSDFLNSEILIAQAMVDIVIVSGLTMLSYHCHELQPTGVSCVGVLLESHISVHTWPDAGVVLLDLFTCGSGSLFPLLPLLKKYFGIPRKDTVVGPYVNPNMLWAHKNRGFKTDENSQTNVQGYDIDKYLVGWIEHEMKTLVASVQTQFQTIEIYDVINPRFLEWEHYYAAHLSDDKSTYYGQNPQFFAPDRMLFINGVIQSRRLGEVAYHEALVHPAMLSHPHPKRVAIIGGGEGATLREVLKHKSVERVVMIEIDQDMVEVSKQYLPEWSDCSNLKVPAADGTFTTYANCFDDPRVTLHLEDATGWFVQWYKNSATISDSDKFDVIIMDSLDPKDMAEHALDMLKSDDFVSSISNSLDEADGVFVTQMGEDNSSKDIPNSYFEKHLNFLETLSNQEFVTIKVYTEAQCNFYAPWQFAIAFKQERSMVTFYSNQAEAEYELFLRGVETNDGADTPFKYFDGAMLQTYQFSSRINENKFCRTQPTPVFCANQHGYDPELPNIPMSGLEVRSSTIEGAGRGIFFKQDFANGTYLGIDGGVQALMFMPKTTSIAATMAKKEFTKQWKTFEFYTFGYGFSFDYFGKPGFSVDPNIMTFINHGCNGTYNMASKLPFTELDATEEEMPPILYYSPESSVYNIFIDRNIFLISNAYDRLTRDVKAGEELLDNYLLYLNNDNWKTGLLDYRTQCLKQAKGAIRVYESEDTRTQ